MRRSFTSQSLKASYLVTSKSTLLSARPQTPPNPACRAEKAGPPPKRRHPVLILAISLFQSLFLRDSLFFALLPPATYNWFLYHITSNSSKALGSSPPSLHGAPGPTTEVAKRGRSRRPEGGRCYEATKVEPVSGKNRKTYIAGRTRMVAPCTAFSVPVWAVIEPKTPTEERVMSVDVWFCVLRPILVFAWS